MKEPQTSDLDRELFFAARDGDLKKLTKALKANANPNKSFYDESNSTTLITATWNNRVSIIQPLLEAGANPNARTLYGNTALTIAAKFNLPLIIKKLIIGKADVNIVDYDGHNALYHAVYHGNLAIMMELLLAGARIEEHTHSSFSMILSHAKENKIFYNDQTKTCKNKCVIILNLLEKVVSAQPDEIISLIDSGMKPFIPLSPNIWVTRLSPNTHQLLFKWMSTTQTDARACFATFYAGTGYTHQKLTRPRYLTNAHGLRPIRIRLVSYLVQRQSVRTICSTIQKSFSLPLLSVKVEEDEESDSDSDYSDFSDDCSEYSYFSEYESDDSEYESDDSE